MTCRWLPWLAVILLQQGVVAAPAQENSTTGWIRQTEILPEAEGATTTTQPLRMRLEIASQRFESAEVPGSGPVTLVGVTHIGDAGYYRALAEHLAGFDAVLYESVAPDGAKGVSGADASERTINTRAAMNFVATVIEWHRRNTGTLPVDLVELIDRSVELDTRFPGWLGAATVDAWNSPLQFEIHEVPAVPGDEARPPSPARTEWRLRSAGSDRVSGGTGADDDILIESEGFEVTPQSKGGVQAQIASVLGLAFQLKALDYRDPRWVLADMTEVEMRTTAAELGVDVAPLLDGLGGGGLSGRLGRMVLMLMRLADFFSGNQVRDIVKIVLVEALSDPDALDMAQAGMPGMDGLMDLILHERNRVALEILELELRSDPDRSFALFYGAAHMPGLAEGLRALGYLPVGEPEWLVAIDIDLESSQVDPSTMAMIRGQLETALGRRAPGNPPPANGDQD